MYIIGSTSFALHLNRLVMVKKLKDMGLELNDLAIAMCDYIQTGQKTEQLSKFWDNEDSFYQF